MIDSMRDPGDETTFDLEAERTRQAAMQEDARAFALPACTGRCQGLSCNCGYQMELADELRDSPTGPEFEANGPFERVLANAERARAERVRGLVGVAHWSGTLDAVDREFERRFG